MIRPAEPILQLLRIHAGVLLVVWTALMLVVTGWFVFDERAQRREAIRREAAIMFERDLLYRSWVAGRGGVYVPVTPQLQPNPHLAHLPERDLLTPAGRQLTLVSPDFLNREIYALDADGVFHGHVTSLHPIRPEDAPDPWERQALEKLQQGAGEQSAFVTENGKQVYRFMRPLTVEATCIGCHREHGYQIGEVHGALSFSLAVDELFAARRQHFNHALMTFLPVWFFGTVGILYSSLRLRGQMQSHQQQSLQLSRAEQDVEQLTYFDPLTGLPNRLRFSSLMAQQLRIASSNGGELAVGVIGVDHYKKLRNTLGHRIGEELLRGVVQRVAGLRQQDDILASLSEGRLLLLLSTANATERITPFIQRLRKELALPILVEGQEYFVTATCGFACYPLDGDDEKSLIAAADAAYSRAKTMGRNSFLLYSRQLKTRALEQLTLENTLRRALERGELEVHYQPQVDVESGRIVGAEALLRWRNPELGVVSPTEFIPLAEESGMIFSIGQWVLINACRDACRWSREFGQSIKVSVNVSPRQFQQTDLVAAVDRALADSGLDPSLLMLEITEGSIVEDVDRAVALLTELKARGVRIAIDDFGTGYSSLSYLRNFPIDTVKIDKSFVLDIHLKENSNVIVGSIVTMARHMHMEIVAEGVETEAQRDFLVGLGCRTIQGFFYSRPLDEGRFSELLGALQVGSGEYYQWWHAAGGEYLR